MCEERLADGTCLILMVVAGAAKTKKLLPPFEHSAVLRPVESMLLAKGSCSWRMPCMSMACKPFLAATIACRKAYSTEVESSSEGSPLALLDMTPLGFGESCRKGRVSLQSQQFMNKGDLICYRRMGLRVRVLKTAKNFPLLLFISILKRRFIGNTSS